MLCVYACYVMRRKCVCHAGMYVCYVYVFAMYVRLYVAYVGHVCVCAYVVYVCVYDGCVMRVCMLCVVCRFRDVCALCYVCMSWGVTLCMYGMYGPMNVISMCAHLCVYVY